MKLFMSKYRNLLQFGALQTSLVSFYLSHKGDRGKASKGAAGTTISSQIQMNSQ
jgi:hypothetical protein